MLGLGISSIVASTQEAGALIGGRSSSPVLIASYDFNDDTGSGTGSTTIPNGWAKSVNSNTTLYSSITDNTFSNSVQNNTHSWIFDASTTVSSNTGPFGGHAGGSDTLDTTVTSGLSNNSGDHRYLYFESSSPAANGSSVQRHSIRTNELDFSAYSTITMTFWFHAFGGAFGLGRGCGIAATTSTTSASSAAQAGTGLGFTSDTAGGATIVYTDLGSTSRSVSRIGNNGQVQTTGHTAAQNASTNHWVKATCDLSAAAGESSVYIYFAMFTNANIDGNNFFQQDIAIDSIAIIGQ